jgi:hypothetical protein
VNSGRSVSRGQADRQPITCRVDDQLDGLFGEFRRVLPVSFGITLRPFGRDSYWILDPRAGGDGDLRSGLTSLAAGLSSWFTSGVFIGTEIRLEVGFSTAQARLANLVGGGLLEDASHEAYDTWTTGLARVGPFGAAPGLSRLVQVHIRALAQQEDSARWAMRWQATGAGTLFPALDADLKLTPAVDDATTLAVSGVYRPPLGSVGAGLDRVVMNRIARASIRAFARRIGTAITAPATLTPAPDAARQIKPCV